MRRPIGRLFAVFIDFLLANMYEGCWQQQGALAMDDMVIVAIITVVCLIPMMGCGFLSIFSGMAEYFRNASPRNAKKADTT
jgi:hypothetical protein